MTILTYLEQVLAVMQAKALSSWKQMKLFYGTIIITVPNFNEINKASNVVLNNQ